MNLQEVFRGCTCITQVPVGWLAANNDNIITFNTEKFTEKLIEQKSILYGLKHRCPNCGATKLINDDCEYCGT